MIPLINLKMISALRTRQLNNIVLGRRSSTISTLQKVKDYVPFVAISLTSFGLFMAISNFDALSAKNDTLSAKIDALNAKTDALSAKIDDKFDILHSDMSKIRMKHEG